MSNMVGDVLATTRDWVVGHRERDLPRVGVTPDVVGKWLLDEWALQVEMAYNRLRWPSPDFRRRLRTELGDAVEMYNERGWVDDPRSYHDDPAPLRDVIGLSHRVYAFGLSADVIPLPHPSGASTWHRTEPGKSLLRQALGLIQGHSAWQAVCTSDT